MRRNLIAALWLLTSSTANSISIKLEYRGTMDVPYCKKVVRYLQDKHDALDLELTFGEGGQSDSFKGAVKAWTVDRLQPVGNPLGYYNKLVGEGGRVVFARSLDGRRSLMVWVREKVTDKSEFENHQVCTFTSYDTLLTPTMFNMR